VEYDYFICHASEDKDLIARPLAHFLRTAGFHIWYDEFTLKIGDSLRASIDRGLATSAHGVAILSPSFFEKSWAKRELAALVSLTTEGRRLLPIWHKVSARDVAGFSPMLADVRAATTERGLQWLAEQIVAATAPDRLQALPITTYNSSNRHDLESARNGLRILLDGRPTTGDVFLYLSAYHGLLRGLFGYCPLVVPAHKLPDAFPFHFAVIQAEGETGPMEITFVVLGPIDEKPIDDLVSTITESIVRSKPFTSKVRSSMPDRVGVGDYTATHSVAMAASRLAPCRNMHSGRPRSWDLSFLVFSGRRDLSGSLGRMRRAGGLHFEIASYDRLLDSSRDMFT
jgi:hypothetical protein